MTLAEIQSQLLDAETLAITAWGEARSYLEGGRWKAAPLQARLDVMSVIVNRFRKNPTRFGSTIKAVCLQPWQFSCWKDEGGHENFVAVVASARVIASGGQPEDPLLREALYMANGLITGRVQDSVKGATHYYANWMPAPPAWAFYDKERTRPIPPVLERFNHRFYVGIK